MNCPARRHLFVSCLLVASCSPGGAHTGVPRPRVGDPVSLVRLANDVTAMNLGKMAAVIEVDGSGVCIAQASKWSGYQRQSIAEPARPVAGQKLARIEKSDGGETKFDPPVLVVRVTDDDLQVAHTWQVTWIDWSRVVSWTSPSGDA